MKMIKQDSLILSPYIALYDIVVPKNHLLRELSDLVDFSFVDNMLKDKYTLNNGRPGYAPRQMFKYLLLKTIYELSDRDVVDRARTDLAFKYFLGIAPEDDVIDASSLTKFRKMRLTDNNIINILLSKTVEIAVNNGIKLSKTIIIDSTHSESKYNVLSAREHLLEVAKNLRKKVYDTDESYTDKMPKKPDNQQIGLYENVIKYCQSIIDLISVDDNLMIKQNIKENMNMLQELIDDTNEELTYSKDQDAKTGHKTADSNFFGYKTHIAMTPERIITAATVTTGEKHDGKELQTLVENSKLNGVHIDTIIGDGAYSEKDNIEYTNSNEIKLVSKLSNFVVIGNTKRIQFDYNKDAKRYVCPAGHMAIRKSLHGKNKSQTGEENLYETHFFDVEKCKVCSLKEKCGYKGGASKTYSVIIKKTNMHQVHQDKQSTKEYQELAKNRYMIEAKNAELKSQYGYDCCTYTGIEGMKLQAAVSLFTVNLKRILTLKKQCSATTTPKKQK
jgi:transposase